MTILSVTGFPPLSALVAEGDPVEDPVDAELEPPGVVLDSGEPGELEELEGVVPPAPLDEELHPAAATIARADPSPMTAPNSLCLIM